MSHRPWTMARRDFLLASGALAASAALGPMPACAKENPLGLKKAVKYGMIQQGGSVQEKFELIKSLGFQGVELDSPSDVKRDEAKAAAEATGIVIHGIVDSVHWNIRLSDPDEKVREKGRAALEQALDDCKFYGGTTVLLVPGKVTDEKTENYDQVWDRSTEQIKKALPVAEKLGVAIAIEVVWNNFITKPEQLVKFVDQFDTPHLGAYFDCSNMLKYKVPAAEWIRQLDKRMLKFDFKGYSHEQQWVAIGEGDEDWPEVIKALKEVGYTGWATAEVAGGGEKELKDISERMDKILAG